MSYLMLAAITVTGWQMARELLRAQEMLARQEGDPTLLQAKIATARLYADHMLSKQRSRHGEVVIDGSESTLALASAMF